MVESTFWDDGGWSDGCWVVDLTALAGLVAVALGALAGESADDVGRVGRADIAEPSYEVVTLGADASFISVDLVSAAGGLIVNVRVADALCHVVAQDADAFAEDIIVDLVEGAINNARYGAGCWRRVSGVGDIGRYCRI